MQVALCIKRATRCFDTSHGRSGAAGPGFRRVHMAGIKTIRLHEFSTGEAGTPGLWLRGGLPPLQYNPLRNWGSLMGMKRLAIGFVVAMFVLAAHDAFGQQKKVKVIADQDSAGPQGTNFLSLLMLLRAPQIELLGITTVSGDQWVSPATVFALWATEQAGRTDVPVIKGAEQPLVNTRREEEL